MAKERMISVDEAIINNTLSSEAVKIDNLHKSYGKKEVIKGISLSINKGEIFGFLGKNGVGKSTTIDCLVGLKDFEEGEIKIFDLDVKKSS